MSNKTNSNNDTNNLFNKLAISDLIRLGYTYAIFIFVAMILVNFQALEYPHVFIMTVLYVLFTLFIEILWLFGFSKRFRSDAGKNYDARDLFHNILNNILPFAILIFGYAILLDAFRSGHFASDGQHIEFYIRGMTSIVFLVAYIYLFYQLVDRIITSKSNLTGEPYEGWSSTYVDQQDVTKYDNIIDLLYNLFQPVTVLVISAIIYFFIRSLSFTPVSVTVPDAPM